MERRIWLKGAGLAIAAAGLGRFVSVAGPVARVSFAPGIADDVIRLSSNENPYGPSIMAQSAMARAVGMSNRYQWKMVRELMDAIAAKHGVGKGQVVVGAGSTQIIDMVIQLAAQQKGNFVMAEPTFGRWAGAAESLGLQKITVPLTAGKQHDLDAMRKAVNKDTRLVYVCNPNNPTGTICDREALISFVETVSKNALVLVDEAYIDYTRETSLCGLTKGNEKLIIARTFSKIYGLAGARIGYGIAHEQTAERMSKLLSGANVGLSAVSMAGALASLNDTMFVQSSYMENEAARAFTMGKLERLGIKCVPSQTNFVYFSLASYGKDFFGLLKANNIEGTNIFEPNGNWSRITVGTLREMESFIAAIS